MDAPNANVVVVVYESNPPKYYYYSNLPTTMKVILVLPDNHPIHRIDSDTSSTSVAVESLPETVPAPVVPDSDDWPSACSAKWRRPESDQNNFPTVCAVVGVVHSY